MKQYDLYVSLGMVAIISSIITILLKYVSKYEGFDTSSNSFTREEQAKLDLLRDPKLFQLDYNPNGSINGITSNIPIWTKQELRITNANEKNGAITIQRNNGKSATLSIKDTPSTAITKNILSQKKQNYFYADRSRELIVRNGDNTEDIIQPFSMSYVGNYNNKYLSGYPTDPKNGKIYSQTFTDPRDAYRECTRIASSGSRNTCGGITRSGNRKTYTLRVGSGGLKNSPSNEVSILQK